MACRVGSMAASFVLLLLIGTAAAARPVQIEGIELAEGEEAIGDAMSQETWGNRLRHLLAPFPSYFRPTSYRPTSYRPTSRPTYPRPTYSRPTSRPTYTRPTYRPTSQPTYGQPPPPPYGGRPGYPTTPAPRPTANSNAVATGQGAGSCRSGDSSTAMLIACTNAYRANPGMSRCGGGMRPVGPLRANAQLMAAAGGHSSNMARSGRMSHTLGGSSMSSRVRGSGYPGGTMAENIAAGQRDAKSVVESWMCSSGHRKNMMSCSYGDLGVGVDCRTGRCYWTQNFGCTGGCGCSGGGSSGGSSGRPSFAPQSRPSSRPSPRYSGYRPRYYG